MVLRFTVEIKEIILSERKSFRVFRVLSLKLPLARSERLPSSLFALTLTF